jgi:hypothetical protein
MVVSVCRAVLYLSLWLDQKKMSSALADVTAAIESLCLDQKKDNVSSALADVATAEWKPSETIQFTSTKIKGFRIFQRRTVLANASSKWKQTIAAFDSISLPITRDALTIILRFMENPTGWEFRVLPSTTLHELFVWSSYFEMTELARAVQPAYKEILDPQTGADPHVCPLHNIGLFGCDCIVERIPRPPTLLRRASI